MHHSGYVCHMVMVERVVLLSSLVGEPAMFLLRSISGIVLFCIGLCWLLRHGFFS